MSGESIEVDSELWHSVTAENATLRRQLAIASGVLRCGVCGHCKDPDLVPAGTCEVCRLRQRLVACEAERDHYRDDAAIGRERLCGTCAVRNDDGHQMAGWHYCITRNDIMADDDHCKHWTPRDTTGGTL